MTYCVCVCVRACVRVFHGVHVHAPCPLANTRTHVHMHTRSVLHAHTPAMHLRRGWLTAGRVPLHLAHHCCTPQERYPLLYASLDALTLADVRGLLVQYKELVLKYEALAMVSPMHVGSCPAGARGAPRSLTPPLACSVRSQAVDQQHQQHQEHPAESDHSAGPATAQPSSTSLPALAAGWPSQQSLQPQLPPPPPPPPSQQQPPQPSPAHDDTAFTLSPLPPSCTATPERSAADLQALKGLGGSEG